MEIRLLASKMEVHNDAPPFLFANYDFINRE